MDEAKVVAIRKTLEGKSTAELHQAYYESGEQAAASPEEREATRQLLAERLIAKWRLVGALALAVLMGGLGAAGAWAEDYPDNIVVFAALGGALLGFALPYLPPMMHGEPEKGSRGRAAPVCNGISLAAPFVGFACGVVAGGSAGHMQWVEWGFRVWFGFGLGGFLFGVIGLVRAERWWGIALSGILLNLVVLGVTWDLAIHGR